MKRTMFSISLSALIIAVLYIDCNPYAYRNPSQEYADKERDRIDRQYPKKHEIHPDGRGGYYYY